MLTWIKKRLYRFMSHRAGMDETSVVIQGWVPDEWLADFVIARTQYRQKTQAICRLKTSTGDLWEIHDAE